MEPFSKYRAVRTNGYASKAEAKRAGELRLLQQCGAIGDLREQVKFELLPKDGKERAVVYVCDFYYLDVKTGKWIVEDVKGFRTPVYKLKKRMMWALRGIRIQEV